jgi:hypothetical protein
LDDQTALAAQTQEAAIQQLNLSYSPEQDRLLLRVGLSDHSELVIWLTHRVTRQLWTLLNGEAHIPTAHSIQAATAPQQAVQQFVQEMQAAEHLSQMDFETEYQAREQVRSDGILLATGVEYETEGTKRLHLICLEGLTAHINLSAELILALCNMLQLSAKEAGWDIAKASAPTISVMPADRDTKQVLH